MFPCSRNARPQKDNGERPGALLARRAPTMKQWSLNARSGDYASRLDEKRVDGKSGRSAVDGICWIIGIEAEDTLPFLTSYRRTHPSGWISRVWPPHGPCDA